MTDLIQDFVAKATVIAAIQSAKPRNIKHYENGVRAINGGTFAIANWKAGERDHKDFGARTDYYINNVLAHEEITA